MLLTSCAIAARQLADRLHALRLLQPVVRLAPLGDVALAAPRAHQRPVLHDPEQVVDEVARTAGAVDFVALGIREAVAGGDERAEILHVGRILPRQQVAEADSDQLRRAPIAVHVRHGVVALGEPDIAIEPVDLLVDGQRGRDRLRHLDPPHGVGGQLDEGAVALFALADGQLGLPAGPGESQQAFDPSHELAGGERLHQEVVRAGRERLDAGLFAGPRREQDDGQRTRARMLPAARAAARSRPAPASSRRRSPDRAARARSPRARLAPSATASTRQPSPSRRTTYSRMSALSSATTMRGPRARWTRWPAPSTGAPRRDTAPLRARSAARGGRSRPAPPGGGPGPAGRVTRKAEPRPIVLCASTVPPCRCTSSWTSARPIPVPSCVRRAALAHAMEALEDPVKLLFRDAGAGVADLERDRCRAADQPHRDARPRW